MTTLKTKLAKPMLANLLKMTRSQQKIWHFSFHKNLTVYYKTVSNFLAQSTGRSYCHFNSLLNEFQKNQQFLDIASLNNHFIDTREESDTTRCSLFIRDPRDLIVSGYYYHRRGAEAWCRIKDPKPADFKIVNGCIPTALMPGESFQDCLNRLPLSEGLSAEIEFRKLHLDSLSKWMKTPPQLVMKYEDIIENEEYAFQRIGRFYRLNFAESALFVRQAVKNSASKRSTKHVRNPKSGQWRKVFPEETKRLFHDEFGELLHAVGYTT
jgi:hypothetical protein